MRLLLFSLLLVSVSARSAPPLNVSGLVRQERREDPPAPEDCCEARETNCWLDTLVHCYEGEWVLYWDNTSCFPFFIYYGCCGRCECKKAKAPCGDHNKELYADIQAKESDPVSQRVYNPSKGSPQPQ